MIEILRNRDSLSSCRDEELADSLPSCRDEEKKTSNTKNIFVFVCYKDRENRKLRRRFRFFVILGFFSSLIRSGLSNGSTDTCNSTPRSDLELASLFSLSFLSCYCTKKRRFSEHFNLQETSLYKRYCKT